MERKKKREKQEKWDQSHKPIPSPSYVSTERKKCRPFVHLTQAPLLCEERRTAQVAVPQPHSQHPVFVERPRCLGADPAEEGIDLCEVAVEAVEEVEDNDGGDSVGCRESGDSVFEEEQWHRKKRKKKKSEKKAFFLSEIKWEKEK